MPLPPAWSDRLTLPLIAAPMFRVSGLELVIAACRAGVIGCFPTINCGSAEELDAWLARITSEVDDYRREQPELPVAPPSANLVVRRTYPRLQDDLAVVARHRVELVVSSVGDPTPIIEPVHEYGGLVFADVASMRHAEKAAAGGVDGLILLTAGAGGQTGWANPFAFVRQAREVFDGPLVLAGGLTDGAALYAAQVLGCDLAYMGTRFIATQESLAPPAYREMVVDARLDDILLTRALTGLPTSILRPSVKAAGLDPDELSETAIIDAGLRDRMRGREIWSAGHSAGGVHDIPTVAELVRRLRAEYETAKAAG